MMAMEPGMHFVHECLCASDGLGSIKLIPIPYRCVVRLHSVACQAVDELANFKMSCTFLTTT